MLIRTIIPVAQMAVIMVAMSARMDNISRMVTSGWLEDGALFLGANVKALPTAKSAAF
jgi:hypothetical protein